MSVSAARAAAFNAEAKTLEALESFAQASGPGKSMLRLAKTNEGVPYLSLVDAQSTLATFSFGDRLKSYLQVGECNLVNVVQFLERSEIFSHLGNYAEERRSSLEQARDKLNEKIRKYNNSGWRSKLHEFVLPHQEAPRGHVEEAFVYDAKNQEAIELGQGSQLEARLERLHKTCMDAAQVTEPIVRQWKEEFEFITRRAKGVIKTPREKFTAFETSVRGFILGIESALAQKALLLIPPAQHPSIGRQHEPGNGLFECFRDWILLQDGGPSKYAARLRLPPPSAHDEYTTHELAEMAAREMEVAVRDDNYLHGLILNDIWDMNCEKNRAWREGLVALLSTVTPQINLPEEGFEARISTEVAEIRKHVEDLTKIESKKAFDNAFDLIDLEVRSFVLEARVLASAAVLEHAMEAAATSHRRKKSATIKRLATQKEKVVRIATRLSAHFFTSQISQQNLQNEEKLLEKVFRRNIRWENDGLVVQLLKMQETLAKVREGCNMLNEETLETCLPTDSWNVAFSRYVHMIRQDNVLSTAVGLHILGRLFRCRIRVYKQEANGVRTTVPVFDQIIRPPQNAPETMYLQYEDRDHFSLARLI